MKKPKEKTYTIHDLFEARRDERRRTFIILNYLINKNSHPLPRGFEHDNFLEDIEDFETELMNN